ncbi:MAG TPA: IS200/IS605 family transposase [Candidatus Brocadiia bacterium]|nr:IS200/IS605 family transposase [Candidatus Brocadiia bacterium]
MGQTLSRILIHLIFTTKNRAPIISPEVEADLYAYKAGILRNHESRVLAIGGVKDHVHLLVLQSRNVALSKLVMHLKKDSSKWIKTKGREFETFAWQDGYGAFSIGESAIEQLTGYIRTQKKRRKEVFPRRVCGIP